MLDMYVESKHHITASDVSKAKLGKLLFRAGEGIVT